MLKACSRCGGLHPYGYKCYKGQVKKSSKALELRGSYAWEKKSLEVREKACWLCEVCRNQGLYIYQGLEVHHIEPIKENPDKYLENNNLVCLCADCHRKAEAGEIGRAELYKLAVKRESV